MSKLISDQCNLKPIPPGWAEPLRNFELYLRALGRAHRTIDTRIRHLRTLARGLPSKEPCEVTEQELITWSGNRIWSPETRHAYHASIRLFFRWLCTSAGTADPSRHLGSIRRPVPPPRPAPDAAITKAIAEADDRTELILRLAAELGLRASEIARLHTDDLTHGPDSWATLVVNGKGGQLRLLPCPPHLTCAIRIQAPDPGGWVFPGNIDGHLSPRWVSKLAAAALPDAWTLHTLRHRFATAAYNAADKHDLIGVQRALGHTSITTTQRYTASATDLTALIQVAHLKGPLR